MIKRKKCLVDMDGVICDYYGEFQKAREKNPAQQYPQSKWGFFLKLPPLPGAIESFWKLHEHMDVWILTRPSPMNVGSYTEKAQWIWDNLGYEVLLRTVFSCDKSLIMGNYLVDDTENANQLNFTGELVKIGEGPGKFVNLPAAVDYILKKEGIVKI